MTELQDLARRSAEWSLSHVPRILLVIALALIMVRAGRKILARLQNKLQIEDTQAGRSIHRSQTLALVLTSGLSITVWSIAILQVLAELGVKLGPLLAGAGIAGVAIGFGAQSLVRDFLTGFFVLLEDQYRVGDMIEIGGIKGVVERFTLRSTSIRSLDGTLHHCSNGSIESVSNFSVGWSKAIVDVVAPYNQSISKVKDALMRAGGEVLKDETSGPLVVEPAKILGVEGLGEDQMTIRVAIKTVPGKQERVARAFRHRVKEVFDDEGIELPTSRTVFVEKKSRSSGNGGKPR